MIDRSNNQKSKKKIIATMGIKNGAPTILSFMRKGIYNRNCGKYKIMIDGEYMRYKGMIESNLTKHNAEEAIAATSYDYMHNIIHNIEGLIGRCADEIRVFMDGTRVSNKETCRADFKFDAGLIRTIFKSICMEHGHSVIELQHGESELQMYLQRDKTMPLNVFLTNDSDMISICYGHRPISKTGKFTLCENLPPKYDYASDANSVYSEPNDIIDSCVWINCSRETVAIGFDLIDDRFIYTPDVFRVFIALCGTDFTSNLLTDSMIAGILTAVDDDKKFINNLTDINEIAACLQMLGIRNGGTIKRATPVQKTKKMPTTHLFNPITGLPILPDYNPNDLHRAITMYREYITTGKMDDSTIPRPNMSNICRQFLYAMKGQDDDFVKKSLNTWARQTTLQYALDCFKSYHGTYNPDDTSTSETNSKPKSRKRKSNSSMDHMMAAALHLRKLRKSFYTTDTESNTDDEV